MGMLFVLVLLFTHFFFWFLEDFVCLLVFKREREEHKGDCVGGVRIWEELEDGEKHDRNGLYKKISNNKKTF